MVAIAIPLRVSGVAPQQGALGLALIGALVIFACDAETRHHVKHAITSRTGILISAIFVVWAISLFFSVNPLGSLKIGGRTGLFVLGITIIWAAIKPHQENHVLIGKIFVVAALGSLIAAVLSLSGVSVILSILKFDFTNSHIPTVALKAFAASVLCMVPVVIWAGRRIGGQWRFWAYAYLPLAVVMILQSHNRAALAGLLAMITAGIIVLLLTNHRHTRLLTFAAVAVSTAILVWLRNDRFVMTARNLDGMYLPEWLIDPHRQQIWKFAFHKFLDHPWFGNGIDQLNKLSGAHEIAPSLGNTAFLIPSHPHNWALEILAETGILGFLPVLIAITYIAWKLIGGFLKTQDEGAIAQLTLVAGFWASALFNFSIWAVWWQLTFFILFAFIAATPPDKHKRP